MLRCRAGAAIGAAALWVSLQAATEITVTDVMQVRTFAEEVYTQLVGGADAEEAIGRAVAATLPFVLLVAVLVGCAAAAVGTTVAGTRDVADAAPGVSAGALALAARLCRRVAGRTAAGDASGQSRLAHPGLVGTPPSWSAWTMGHYLVRACRPPEGWMLLHSLLLAAGAGLLVAAASLLACWAARDSRRFRIGVLVLMAVAWAMPGPLIGLGLKMVIERLLQISDSRWLAEALYHGPSPLPLVWVDVIRFFPCAVAILWPVVRLLPAELSDAARVDGATSGQELRRVVWPLTSTAFGQAALAVAVLSLGELSAGKLVATPGMPGYATEIFTQMHYGVTNELAARCVLLLILVAMGGAAVQILTRWPGNPKSEIR